MTGIYNTKYIIMRIQKIWGMYWVIKLVDFFNTKEEAEKYIEENKPKSILEEITPEKSDNRINNIEWK